MALSYLFEFSASGEINPDALEEFLRRVESLAKSLGFNPTTVLNVPFDTSERQEFSERLGGSLFIQDERLKGVALPKPGQIRDHNVVSGECRVIPTQGVVLVITDDRGCETCFGFLKYPSRVLDIHGRTLAEPHPADNWWFRDFVDSPDPRYRQIVEKFRAEGYVKSVRDGFS